MVVVNELYRVLEVDNWSTTGVYHRTCLFKISIGHLGEVPEWCLVNWEDSKLRRGQLMHLEAGLPPQGTQMGRRIGPTGTLCNCTWTNPGAMWSCWAASWTWAHSVPMHNSILGNIHRSTTSRSRGEVIHPCLAPVDNIWMLCPLLGSPIQEKY